MENNNYTPPKYGKGAFNCPYCEAFAHQVWGDIYYQEKFSNHYDKLLDQYGDIYLSGKCIKCKKYSIWDGQERMLIPQKSTAPSPEEEMPDEVKELYEEARQVQPFSQRASAALLRVALEKLTEILGEKEGNLNSRIKSLKAKGLPETVIQSLDIVRIFANEGGSHAGQIDLTGKDNQEIVNRLFYLVNFIVEKTITEPKKINEQFKKLPESKKDGIKNRDKNN